MVCSVLVHSMHAAGINDTRANVKMCADVTCCSVRAEINFMQHASEQTANKRTCANVFQTVFGITADPASMLTVVTEASVGGPAIQPASKEANIDPGGNPFGDQLEILNPGPSKGPRGCPYGPEVFNKVLLEPRCYFFSVIQS